MYLMTNNAKEITDGDQDGRLNYNVDGPTQTKPLLESYSYNHDSGRVEMLQFKFFGGQTSFIFISLCVGL